MDREVVSIRDWISSPVTVDLPDDAISMAIVVEGDDEQSYTISDWSDDTGFVHAEAGWWEDDEWECLSCATTVTWLRGVSIETPRSQVTVVAQLRHSHSSSSHQPASACTNPVSSDQSEMV